MDNDTLHITIYGERVTDPGRTYCGAQVEPPPRFVGENYIQEIREYHDAGELCAQCWLGHVGEMDHLGRMNALNPHMDLELVDV